MSIASRAGFPKHLDGDINRIFFNEYKAYAKEYDKIAKIVPAPAGDHFTEAELSSIGAVREKAEGTAIEFATPVEGNEVTRRYTAFGLAIQITFEMMQDDLFKNFMKLPAELGKSAAYKCETAFFDLFNSGFSVHEAWDGNEIFEDSARTTLLSGESLNNAISAASLSETSLMAMFEYFDSTIDTAGRPVTCTPRTLLVPTALRGQANVLLKTANKPGSMDNDINTVRDYGGWGIHISRHLTSATAYFVLSDEHDFRFMWKNPVQLEAGDDLLTKNAIWALYMRFATFCNNPIGACGNAGA